MRKATSILSRYKSLVITFKHFSDSDFEFDLCYDFSFWKAETWRCIPTEIHGHGHYSFPPLCDQTFFNCLELDFKEYCPNQDENCEGYSQEKPFFCNNSKTCIPEGELVWCSSILRNV